jgi:hypothetical protein
VELSALRWLLGYRPRQLPLRCFLIRSAGCSSAKGTASSESSNAQPSRAEALLPAGSIMLPPPDLQSLVCGACSIDTDYEPFRQPRSRSFQSQPSALTFFSCPPQTLRSCAPHISRAGDNRAAATSIACVVPALAPPTQARCFSSVTETRCHILRIKHLETAHAHDTVVVCTHGGCMMVLEAGLTGACGSAESITLIPPPLFSQFPYSTHQFLRFVFKPLTILVFSEVSLSEEAFKAVPCFCGSVWLSNDSGKLVSSKFLCPYSKYARCLRYTNARKTI